MFVHVGVGVVWLRPGLRNHQALVAICGLQLLLQASRREDGDEVQHGSHLCHECDPLKA